jgi:MFS family permease
MMIRIVLDGEAFEMRKLGWNFRWLMLSKAISIIGGSALSFALIMFMVDFTESPATLGIFVAASQFPALLLAPFGGIIADRFNKKQQIILFDLLKSGTAFLLFSVLLGGNYSIVSLTLLRTLIGLVGTAAGPVFSSAVPEIVADDLLTEANGLISSISGVGNIIGSIIGGILFSLRDIHSIALFSGVLFLVSALLDCFLKIPYQKLAMKSGYLKTFAADIKESFRFLRHKRPMVFNISLGFSTISGIMDGIFTISIPFMVSQIFNQNLYITYTIASLGMVAGGLLTGKIKQWLTAKQLHKWCFLLAFAILIPGLAVKTEIFWLFNGILFAILTLVTFIGTLISTTIQRETPKHLLGKVASLRGLLSNAINPLCLLFYGFLSDILNPEYFLFLGLMVFVIILSFWMKRTTGNATHMI